jgi:sigma-E factor negative regulatory protein RseC
VIEEFGVVVAVAGDCADVRTERRGTCGGCSADGTCGTSILDRFLGRRPVLVRARNLAQAGVGERVVLGVAEAELLTAALAVYLVPLLGLLGGAFLGEMFRPPGSDLWVLLGGACGFALALSWLRRYSAGVARGVERRPIILRRLDGASIPVSLPGQ